MARSTAELERESLAKGNLCGCPDVKTEYVEVFEDDDDGEGMNAAQMAFDLNTARQMLKRVMVFMDWIADPTLSPKLTKEIRGAADRASNKIHDYLDETSEYDEVFEPEDKDDPREEELGNG